MAERRWTDDAVREGANGNAVLTVREGCRNSPVMLATHQSCLPILKGYKSYIKPCCEVKYLVVVLNAFT